MNAAQQQVFHRDINALCTAGELLIVREKTGLEAGKKGLRKIIDAYDKQQTLLDLWREEGGEDARYQEDTFMVPAHITGGIAAVRYFFTSLYEGKEVQKRAVGGAGK
jgi:phosphoheptose isomerase